MGFAMDDDEHSVLLLFIRCFCRFIFRLMAEGGMFMAVHVYPYRRLSSFINPLVLRE